MASRNDLSLFSPGTEIFEAQVNEATLNLQAIARQYEPLVSSLVPRPGYVFVGNDIESAEPSIIAQYSNDPFMRYLAYEGIGKKPFYKDDIFFCDDQYIALAAITPMFQTEIKRKFLEGVNGRTFGDFWVNTPEAGKLLFKKQRKAAKAWDLGLGYGLSPKGLVKNSLEKGFPITLAQAKQIYNAYWRMRAYVQTFSEMTKKYYKKYKHVCTPFGFRSRPSKDYKCMNALIQGSVNPIIDMFTMYLEEEFYKHGAHFLVCIHDEVMWECPISKVKLFNMCKNNAQKKLNDFLQWDIPLRFGFVVGRNFFEAKDGISEQEQAKLGIDTSYLRLVK